VFVHKYTNDTEFCLQQSNEAVTGADLYLKSISQRQQNVNEKLRKQGNKKVHAEHLAEAYATLGKHKKADRVFHCCDYIVIGENTDGKAKVIKAHYCKARLCPMCQKRLSSIKYRQLSNALAQLETIQHYRYIHVILTVKNVTGDNLRLCLESILKAYNKLIKKPAFIRSFAGAYRSLEITYNEKAGTFHPHIHVLLPVTEAYFKHKNPLYFTQKRLCEIWQSALCDDYKPLTWITPDKKKQGDLKTELSKYVSKYEDYIDLENPILTAEKVKYLDSALHGLRLHSFSGILKKADKEFTATDYTKGLVSEFTENKKCYKWVPKHQAYICFKDE